MKCVTKNDEKNCEKYEILAYLKNYAKPKFTSKIIDFGTQKLSLKAKFGGNVKNEVLAKFP